MKSMQLTPQNLGIKPLSHSCKVHKKRQLKHAFETKSFADTRHFKECYKSKGQSPK